MDGHVTFVVNPAACSGRGANRWEQLEPSVRAAFPQADVRFTTERGHAERIAAEVMAEAAADEDRLLVAVGGDGTVHEVASGLLRLDAERRARARLGVLQNGTGNDFVRGAGIPQQPEAALALLQSDAVRVYDACRLRCRALQEETQVTQYFLNAGDFGIGAEVVRKVESAPRWMSNKPSYLWQTLRALMAWRNPTVHLRLDDGEVEEHAIKTVALCNQPWFGGGMCVAPDAVPDDGKLQCTVFGDLGRLEAMRRLNETYRGTYVRHERISYRSCRTLEATSTRDVMIETDGELAGRLPVRFEVMPGALRVVAT